MCRCDLTVNTFPLRDEFGRPLLSLFFPVEICFVPNFAPFGLICCVSFSPRPLPLIHSLTPYPPHFPFPTFTLTTNSRQQTKYTTFVINVKAPLDASLFDTKAFVEFLTASFKPTKGGKRGNVGVFDSTATKEQNALAFSKSVIISPSASGHRVLIHTKTPMSKQYLKYMTKKFLKKNDLRDFMRVVATGTKAIKVAFLNVKGEKEETEEAAPAEEETVE